MKWIEAIYNSSSHYLANEELRHINTSILVTYVTPKGRRYVRAALCDHGRLAKKINGTITAFMFMPEPYKGEANGY